MSFIVAIDGPAGTGKGTITNLVAKKMNLINIDTGATYRCVALAVLKNNIQLNNEEEIIKIAKNIDIDFKQTQNIQKVFLNGEEVTKEIRTPMVSSIVSQVSSIIEVRLQMVELQRKLAKGKDVIMEGRDITTYVFPNADVKIYMDADEEERAKRRFLENKEKGSNETYEEVLQAIRKRDKLDKEKKMGALKIAEDAIYVDTTNKTIQELEEEILKIITNVRNKKGMIQNERII